MTLSDEHIEPSDRTLVRVVRVPQIDVSELPIYAPSSPATRVISCRLTRRPNGWPPKLHSRSGEADGVLAGRRIHERYSSDWQETASGATGTHMTEQKASEDQSVGPKSGTNAPESIGPMLQRLRQNAGRSQSDQAFVLSDLAARPVTRNDVSRWENEGRLVSQGWLDVFARSFGIPEVELHRAVVVARSTRRKQQPRSRNKTAVAAAGNQQGASLPVGIQEHIPVLRRMLDLYDFPQDGPVAPLPELRNHTSQLVRLRLNSEYAILAVKLQDMIPALTRALFTYRSHTRAEVASLLVQAYRAADAIADKFGLVDLSARTISVIDWAARQADSSTTVAISAYVRGETFFNNQQFSPGRKILEIAAEELQLGVSSGESAAYGALHMRAAVLAARAGEAEQARDHLRAAHGAAQLVEEGIYGGTAFGPSSVRIHEVSLALSLDDPTGALAAAAGWEPADSLPSERRSHFYVDLALAQSLAGRYEHVIRSLHKAWTIAPQHVRAHLEVRGVLATMAEHGGTIESGARDLCRRADIHLAN
jgi:tetratricopeptide (TPR) repeat protein